MLSSWKGYCVEWKNKRLELKAESEGSVLHLFVLVDPFDFSVCVCRTTVLLILYQYCKTFIIALWHLWEVISKSRANSKALSSFYTSMTDLDWHKSALCSGVSHTFAWLLVSHPVALTLVRLHGLASEKRSNRKQFLYVCVCSVSGSPSLWMLLLALERSRTASDNRNSLFRWFKLPVEARFSCLLPTEFESFLV